LCALFGVSLRELRARRVYGVSDVVRALGLPLVGVVPSSAPESCRDAKALPRELNEAADAIRTVLLQRAAREPMRVVLVTSARRGEGKTGLARLLATSLARAWRETVLIDADLRHPDLHRLFDVPLEPGFSEVLRGEVALADAVRPTPVSRLWMISAGHSDDYALQALAQKGVSGLFDKLAEEYEFIVIDAGPMLPVADSLMLAQHADGAILSALCDVSRLPMLEAAHQRLASVRTCMLGAVVQGAPREVYGKV
jgi:capsular exopolysaccharide synthesis family protein